MRELSLSLKVLGFKGDIHFSYKREKILFISHLERENVAQVLSGRIVGSDYRNETGRRSGPVEKLTSFHFIYLIEFCTQVKWNHRKRL